MQPYLFPYIGYFHLIDAVDIFVCFDDVNFIKKGWINRNNILLDGQAHRWSLPLIKASQNKLIMDHDIFEPEKAQKNLLNKFQTSYKEAPQYNEIMPLFEEILNGSKDNIADLIKHSLEKISAYLALDTKFDRSSNIKKDPDLPAQTRIISMVKELGGTHYINATGGQELYDRESFEKEDLKLSFIKSGDISYEQYSGDFVPYLSIVDVLMFNDRKSAQDLAKKYTLISQEQ